VVTRSSDRTARLWDAASGAPIGQPMRHEGAISSFAFSPDGRRLAISDDRTMRLWDAATGAPIGQFMGHEGEATAEAFSPDGARVLIASFDRTARLWDAATGAPLGPPLRHEGVVIAAAFSPDGTRVLTGSADHTARLWDVRWPQGPITAVACTLLRDRDVTNLADRYGVRIRDAICGSDMPAPDLARLEPG
jgi:WD40 repeat protein